MIMTRGSFGSSIVGAWFALLVSPGSTAMSAKGANDKAVISGRIRFMVLSQSCAKRRALIPAQLRRAEMKRLRDRHLVRRSLIEIRDLRLLKTLREKRVRSRPILPDAPPNAIGTSFIPSE